MKTFLLLAALVNFALALEPSEVNQEALQHLINQSKAAFTEMGLPEELNAIFQGIMDDPDAMHKIVAENWTYLAPFLQDVGHQQVDAEERRIHFSPTRILVNQVIKRAIKAITNN